MSVPGELPHFHYETLYSINTMTRRHGMAVELWDLESDSPGFNVSPATHAVYHLRHLAKPLVSYVKCV